MRSMLRAASVALALVVVAGAAQAQASFKIAFVNTQALMEAAPGRAGADSALQKVSEGFRLELKKLQDSLNALALDYQKKEPTLSATVKDTRQKAMQALETDLQAKNLQLQSQFAQKQQELYAPVTEAVKSVLETIREEGGYSIILANDPGQSVIVSADKNLDITDKVVARLRTIAATTKTNATKPGTANPTGVVKPPVRPPTQ